MRCRYFVLLIALAASATQAKSECKLVRYAEMPVTMVGMRPTISGTINGAEAHFLVDSGAFFNMMWQESALKYQLKVGTAPLAYVQGIGGSTSVGLTTIKNFTLAGFGTAVTHNVQFLVGGNSSASSQIAGIIGQNLLSFADAEYDLANGVIRLFRSQDCKDQSLAYWAGTALVAEMAIEETTPTAPHLIGPATINDKRIRVVFDTGASRSILSVGAAGRAGLKPEQTGVMAAGLSQGIGRQAKETWIGRFDLLDLGGEQVKNARLVISNFDNELPRDADMLLGADFFLSHRVYVAAKQRKIYFTYNGGRVFDLGLPDKPKATDAAASDPSSNAEATNVPGDAAGFKRRAAASAGRKEFANAIADFDRAIKLDATDADSFYQRGLAKLQNRQPVLAMSDFDEALKFKPDHIFALVERGSLRLFSKDEAGARTDFDTALTLTPNDPSLSFRVAQTYVNARHFDEAISRLDKWIAANPKDDRLPSALNGRCWSRAMLGIELDLALADCNAAVKSSRNSYILDGRAFVYLRLGNFDKSITDYKASLSLQPKSAWSLYGLGIAEIKKGLASDGQKDMKAALSIAPRIDEEFKRLGLMP
jgi:tetratricopeptide (TPR) repeat protein